MEGLKLDVREQQYYGELFQACDSEGTGKITGPRASELFLASGLGSDVLKQITELCGAKRLGHFGRSQFYIALKLVAFAQAGLPIKLDALNSGKDVPLPKFSSKGNEQVFATGDRKKSCGDQDGGMSDSNKTNAQLSGQLPPPPASKKSHSRSLSGQYRGVVVPDSQVAVVSSQSSQFPTQSPPTSPVSQKLLLKQNTAPATVFAGGGGGSLTNISASMTQADSSEPTAQVSDGGHVNPLVVNDVSGAVRGQVNSAASSGQSQSQQGQSVIQASSSQVMQQQAVAAPAAVTSSAPVLQGNMQQPGQGNIQQPSQENGNWTMFEDDESHMLIGQGLKQQYSSLEPPNFDSSSISSETESVDDVWSITDEQREYYINQFKTMQPDLSAVITGPVAKHFFEKSKLPVLELSKIWQLSDLNRDGVLSLEEFCIAMHLVVLRRNDIELPDHLPLSLMPYSTLGSDEPFAADLPPGSTLKRLTPPSPQQNLTEWTAFSSESPESGDLHSPTHLANFEFAKPSADPDLKIVQPVPIHMLPDGRQPASDGSDRGRAFSDSAVLHELGPSDSSPPLKQRSSTECPHHHESSQLESSNKYTNPVQGRPRPVTHKQNPTVPAIVRGQLPPPGAGQDGSSSVGVVERPNDISGGPVQSHAPPTPPPRPLTGRSLSMDVKSNPSQLLAPAIPPRVSPKEVHSAQKIVEAGVTSATETQSGSTIPPSELTVQDGPQVLSAPVVKDLIEDDDITEQLPSKPALAIRQGSRDRRDIHIALRTHKERNTMLTRLNSELNQELQEVMEQRIALEIQLEHLRPFSS